MEKLAMDWISYKISYDMVLQSCITTCLKCRKYPDEVINFIEKTMKNKKEELTIRGRSLAETKVQKSLFQGYILWPLLYIQNGWPKVGPRWFKRTQAKERPQTHAHNLPTGDMENINSSKKGRDLLLANKPGLFPKGTERMLQRNQRHSTSETRARPDGKKNLAMAWIDYKRHII